MICPMHTSECTSTIESAVYANRTYGAVRGRGENSPSYSIIGYSHAELDERAEIARKDHKEATENGYTSRFCQCGRRDD
jgi:hypothetical protein